MHERRPPSELWRMYKAGESILGIARAMDRGSSAVRRVLESTGGISPPVRRRSPRVLSFVGRRPVQPSRNGANSLPRSNATGDLATLAEWAVLSGGNMNP